MLTDPDDLRGPQTRFDRRRLLALLGAGAVAGMSAAATHRFVSADVASITSRATATEQAVRLDPPQPQGGFDPRSLYVAIYGHPGSSVLGVLGEQPVGPAADRAIALAGQYARFGRSVVPTFEIITTVASSSAGADGDYSNEFPASKFVPWIDEAARRGIHVICDLQPGRATFPSQAREIESLLSHRHVSLALDPEWRVGPTQRPGGGRIGTVDGREVNETIAYLDSVVQRYRLPPKVLVVHQFTPSMVTNKALIRGTANVIVLFQMDGFGTLDLKLGSWGRMIADLPPGALVGWKNFYDEDRPTPSPAQTMAVTPTPTYVSYQ